MKMKLMNEYEFSIVIRDADFSDLNVHDALFESGCDDALICANNNTVYLQFTREANSAQEAIYSALSNIKDAGFKDLIIEESSAITISEIASKAELSRQAIHNYVKGLRGNGNFPKPIAGLSSNNPLYDWYEVAQWLNNHNALSNEGLEVAEVARYFNHNMPVSLTSNLQAEIMNIITARSIYPNLHGMMQCIDADESSDFNVGLSSFGKRSQLYESVHEVVFNHSDPEDSKNLSFLSAHR